MAYYSELFIHDRAGLVNHDVAMMPADDSRLRSPGHDKSVDVHYFLEHKPEVIRARLVNGLKLMERGNTEQEARARFRATLMSWGRQLENPPYELDDRYVVDFKPVPDWEDAGAHQYLVMWRRIPDGVSPSKAWQDFRRRARLYRNGIDENRAIMEDGYPRLPRHAP